MGYIFGPVPSRRLGRSLGVDLVPFKTCSYDCIYCQLGQTTCKTIDKREWVPLEEVVDELKEKIALKPDYITLAGSGEPTLYARIGELIDRIHSLTDIPVAVLTNGSLLWQPESRRQLKNANLVIPSLDAGNEEMFNAVNRPHPAISFQKMVQGLIDFRKEFEGAYWLEVFFLAGHNATENQARQIVNIVRQIHPDRTQLNTATRPTAENYALQVDSQQLAHLAAQFAPPAEVIADYRGVHAQTDFKIQRENVLEMIQRRPCSIEDIANGLALHRNQVVKYIEELKAENLLQTHASGDRIFYSGKTQP